MVTIDERKETGTQLMQAVSDITIVQQKNDTGIICFDVEATDLEQDAEVLQISIIDGNGKCLLDKLVKPYWHDEWPEAEKINGIAPEMVKDAPFAHDLIPIVKGYFESANVWISYGGDYDLRLLKSWGIDPEGKELVDVMKLFAPVYGEWNEKYESYKWQSLTTAAAYYDYKFDAHNSLSDCKATLYVYNAMMQSKEA